MISCILGTILAQRLRRESIYTIKLIRRGIDLQAGQEVNVLRKILVRDVMHSDLETVPLSAPLDDIYHRLIKSPHYEFFVVDQNQQLEGVISVDDLRRNLPHLEHLRGVAIAEDLMTRPVTFLREDDTLDCAMRQFAKRTFEELPVLPAGEGMVPIGYLQRQDVIQAYNKEILKVDLPGSLAARIETASRFRTWETVGDYLLAQTEAPPHLCGKPLHELHLREKRGVQLILIDRVGDRSDSRFAFPRRDSVLHTADRIIVFGRRKDVEALVRETG